MSGYIGAEQFIPQEQASTTMGFQPMDFENPYGPMDSMTDLMGEDYLYGQQFSNFNSGFPQMDNNPLPLDPAFWSDPAQEQNWPDADPAEEPNWTATNPAGASGYGSGDNFMPATAANTIHSIEPRALDLLTQPYFPSAQPPFQPPTPPTMTPDQLAEYYAAGAKYYSDRFLELGHTTTTGHVIGEVPPTANEAQAPQDPMEIADDNKEPSTASPPAQTRLPKRKAASSNPTAAARARVQKETLISSGLQRFSKTSPEQLKSRTRKILEYDARAAYKDVRTAPFESWGPNNCFSYTMDCELLPGSTFTVEQMHHYLFNHPRGFRMWIQRNPADSKRRYGHSASARCRMQDCPADYQLIGQAQYRVAFDERCGSEAAGSSYDPMHCAMYCHLFCIERFLDLPSLCATHDVRAEDRHLPLEPAGRNRMLFSSEQELELAQHFITTCKKRKVPRSYPRDHSHQGSLTHMLAMKKVELEPRRISAARKERNARSTFDVHLGDLELENAERAKSRRPQWQHQRKSPSSSSEASLGGKRKRVESDDEEEEEDELAAAPQQVRKSTRSMKGKSVAVMGQKGRKRRVVESSEEEEESEEESSDEEYRPRTRSRTLRRSS